MTAPLESNFLVPNGSLLVALLLGVLLVSVVVGGLVLFLIGRRAGAATDR
jgi:membrane protein DedA with SNARE-associated domain